MQAVVYTGPQELRYQQVDEPHPAPGEVVVAVTGSGICGSELHGVASASPFRVPPLIMGHEFTGVRLDTGARVAVNPLVACLECDLCRRGRANLCRDRVLIGIQRAGGFAERVAVPARNLYPIGDLPAEAGTIIEPLANAVHAWRLPAERNPQRVGIIGAGTIGLVSLLVARSRGVPDIEVCDLAEERLAVAERLGASRVGPALDGEYDLVIDAVGVEATRRDSVARTRPGGGAVWIGLHDETPGFASLPFVRLEKTVHGTFCYTHDDFETAIRLAATVDTSWVTAVPLSEGPAVFGGLMRGRTDLVKVQLVP
ncbi:MAG: alcohol dehydrogenase catalytic domain-containing protein [Carbonactinosporaceae bacterium]